MEQTIKDKLINKSSITESQINIILDELKTIGDENLTTDKDRILSIFIAVYEQTRRFEKTMLFIHNLNKFNLWKKLEKKINDYDKLQVMKFSADCEDDTEEYQTELFIFMAELETAFGKLFVTESMAFYGNYGLFEEIMIDLDNVEI